MPTVPERVERYVRDRHADLLESTGAAADEVAAGWDGDWTADRSAVVGPLESALRERDLLDRFPAVLAGAVHAAGFDLPATPVAAPPYVTVTSRGPVLRATVAEGRLVVALAAFEVERDGGVRYVRATGDPVEAAFHRSPEH